MTYSVRLQPNRAVYLANRVASMGYAIPGTVIAIGVLIPFANLDNALDLWMRQTFGDLDRAVADRLDGGARVRLPASLPGGQPEHDGGEPGPDPPDHGRRRRARWATDRSPP
ncbi:MAG: hypothetical protein U5L06_13660 [Rhodovibrio sp.]|nr:hypothetical protein [Rhodovibrio sp.]